MKKTLLLLLILSASAWSQTAPNAYTTNYRIRQWASGANPGADSLNANWALIDSMIRRPRYTIQDSVIIGTTASITPVQLFVNGDMYVADAASILGDLTLGSILYADSITSSVSATGVVNINDTLDVNGYVRADSLYLESGGAYLSGRLFVASDYSQFGDSAMVGRETIDVGVLRFSNGASGPHRMVAPSGATKTWSLPAVTGTFALIDGDQNFTDMGTVKPDSIHSIGGARIDGYVDVNSTIMADSITVGLMAIGSGDIYRDGTAYTNPDYVFQDFYTGESVNPDYEGLRPLSEIEAHTKENHRLPGIKDEPTGIFNRADFLLENVEKLYLYVIAQDKELKRLRAEVEALKGR